MSKAPLNLLLADDDADDCFLFEQALAEIPLATTISTVHDGLHLMNFLGKPDAPLPDMLFLDLNMPRKNGFECLTEIKQNEKLATLPVIIYSTSLDPVVANLIYDKGALYYICKPRQFSKIKEIIQNMLLVISESGNIQPTKSQFILGG